MNLDVYIEDPNDNLDESIHKYKSEEKDGHLNFNGIFFDNDE